MSECRPSTVGDIASASVLWMVFGKHDLADLPLLLLLSVSAAALFLAAMIMLQSLAFLIAGINTSADNLFDVFITLVRRIAGTPRQGFLRAPFLRPKFEERHISEDADGCIEALLHRRVHLRRKPYGIPIPWKYRTKGITHLSWLHELRIVKVARLGFGGTGSLPVFPAGPRGRNQLF